jgi:C-terminal processing protease CtpA/Prc
VRRRIRLTGDETLFLAVGRAVPASGGDYEKVGVRPDIEVPESAAFRFEPPPDRTQSGGPLSGDAETNRRLTLRVGDDPVLGRAVDILLGLKALRSEGRGP